MWVNRSFAALPWVEIVGAKRWKKSMPCTEPQVQTPKFDATADRAVGKLTHEEVARQNV